MAQQQQQFIVTAASAAYGKSLLALLGSLNLNWPDHPPVRIYDIGLDAETIGLLRSEGLDIFPVPAFCPHWRRHFTWKIWCFNDVKADFFLWIDAGYVVLEPLWEAFSFMDKTGFFTVPNYHLLDWEASSQACLGCGLSPDYRIGKRTFAGGLMGFKRTPVNIGLLQEALTIALHEPNIMATETTHRHDQAILSLLLYKYYKTPVFSDGLVFLGWKSPRQVPGQKVWAHRRRLLPEDQVYLARHISTPGPIFVPRDPGPVVRHEPLGRRITRRFAALLHGRKRTGPSEPYDGVRET